MRKDDAVGLIVLKKLVDKKERFPKNITFIECGPKEVNLLHELSNFDMVVIIDAVDFKAKAGESRFFNYRDIKTDKPMFFSSHELDILKIILISKKIREAPDEIYFFGIQPKNLGYGTGLSPELKKNLDKILDHLQQEIKKIF